MFVLSALAALALFSSPAMSQYVFIETALSWSDANDYCASTYGTTLATIRNEDDAALMLEMKDDIGEVFVWIGLHDLNTEGAWEWASGFPCEGDCDSLEWWETGEPNNSNNEDCAEIRSDAEGTDYLLNDQHCSNTNYFACDVPVLGNRMDAVESGLETVESDVETMEDRLDAVESDLETVEERAEAIGWGQYVYVESTMSWQSGEDYCAATYGTSLATIKNDADAMALYEMTAHYRDVGGNAYADFWTGLHDPVGDGSYEWASGFPCSESSDEMCGSSWFADDDSSYADGRCMYVKQSPSSYEHLLRDYACGHASAFHVVCDAPLLGNRMEDVEDRLQSLENAESGSVTAPAGLFGEYADYALYALAVINVLALLYLFRNCMTVSKYGKVVMYDTDVTDKV